MALGDISLAEACFKASLRQQAFFPFVLSGSREESKLTDNFDCNTQRIYLVFQKDCTAIGYTNNGGKSFKKRLPADQFPRETKLPK